jgi:hypothetical protein
MEKMTEFTIGVDISKNIWMRISWIPENMRVCDKAGFPGIRRLDRRPLT